METVDASANNNVSWHHMLKLIVVMGFPSSGKTTCLKGRTVSPLLQGLCNILSGGTDVPVGTKENCREALCMVNGKTVNVYFGADGDSEDIVYENIENIGKSPLPYDVAIITLQRSPVDANLSVGTKWQKWIDDSIRDYSAANLSRPFPNHERYYMHTVIPQICMAANSYSGQIGTVVMKPPFQEWDDLTKCTQDHLLELLSLII